MFCLEFESKKKRSRLLVVVLEVFVMICIVVDIYIRA